MFTCNFSAMFYEREKKTEGLKSFVTAVSTFEMLLWKTNLHAVIQITFPL